MTYELVDAEAKNKADPARFRIPSLTEQHFLAPGDFVKFGFVLPAPIGNVTVENLWVEVTAVHGDLVIGILANTPEYLQASTGDIIRGHRRNVLRIHGPKNVVLH